MHSYSSLSVIYTLQMTLPRHFRYSLLLLLLGLLWAGVHLYRNLDAILQYQIGQSLREFGVVGFELENSRLNQGLFKVDRVSLHGNYGNYSYQAAVTSLEIRYDWRVLLTRKVQSVNLSELDITIYQVVAPTDFDVSSDSKDINIDDLLPQNVTSQIPAQELDIRKWKLHFRSLANRDYFATGKLLYQEQLELLIKTAMARRDITVVLETTGETSSIDVKVAMPDAGAETARIFAQISPSTRSELQWSLQGKLYHSAILDWLQRLPTEISVLPNISIPNDFTLGGSSEFTAQLLHPKVLNIPLESSRSVLQTLDATIELSSNIEQLNYPEKIEGLTGTLNYSLVLLDEQLKVSVEPFEFTGGLSNELLAISKEMQQWLKWQGTVPFLWANQGALEFVYKGGTWFGQLRENRLQLGTPVSQFRLEGLRLNTVMTTNEPLSLNTQLTTTIGSRLRNQEFPLLELTFQQQGHLEQSSYTFEMTDGDKSFAADLSGTVNLTSGDGNHRLAVQASNLPDLSRTVAAPLHNIGLLPSDLEVHSGSISLDSTLNTMGSNAEDWTQESELIVKGISGIFDEYPFNTLALSARWTGIQQWKTVRPVELSLGRLDMGFEVREIRTLASLPEATDITRPALKIEAFSADIFGGQLLLPKPGYWDFRIPSNTLILQAQQWQLAQIVALQQAEDIQAGGTLDGKLPLTVTEGRFVVEKGYLRALPPGGTIRYIANDASRALGKNSKELEMALDLLSDFQYKVLNSTVELDKQGNLLLGLSLSGRNPARFDGRPVNFNINLEQNIDPLLQSLRLSDKLTEEIEDRLR